MSRDRLNRLFGPRDSQQQAYRRIDGDDRDTTEGEADVPAYDAPPVKEFSWVVYAIFTWMGMAMLWGW